MRQTGIVLAAMLCVFLIAVLGTARLGLAAEAKTGSFTLVPDVHGMVLKTPDGRTVLIYMSK